MKYEIVPGFTLEPDKTEKGYIPLQVLTKELAEKLFHLGRISKNKNCYFLIGAEDCLYNEMLEKYGGKKLKISSIERLSFHDRGANFHLKTSSIDKYRWYPYMFIEYWEHLLGETLYTKKEKEVAKKNRQSMDLSSSPNSNLSGL